MYRLLVQINHALEPLRDQFEKHVESAGLQEIETVSNSASSVSLKNFFFMCTSINTFTMKLK